MDGAALELESRGAATVVELKGVRAHGKRLVLGIDGIDDAEAAQKFTGGTFYAPREAIHLDPGEFLDADLIGCALCDASGRRLGTVRGVGHYPGSDMLVVDGHLVPLVAAFVREMDVANKRIVVELPPGLID